MHWTSFKVSHIPAISLSPTWLLTSIGLRSLIRSCCFHSISLDLLVVGTSGWLCAVSRILVIDHSIQRVLLSLLIGLVHAVKGVSLQVDVPNT